MEISGVLSSSSRTTLSKLCPRQRDLIPDFFLRVSRYSASSFADVSSSITLLFREEFVGGSRDIRLAFSTEPFHFCFLEAIFAYHAFENSPKKLWRTLLSFQTFPNFQLTTSSIDTYSESLGCFRKEVGDWDERLPSQNIKWRPSTWWTWCMSRKKYLELTCLKDSKRLHLWYCKSHWQEGIQVSYNLQIYRQATLTFWLSIIG